MTDHEPKKTLTNSRGPRLPHVSSGRLNSQRRAAAPLRDTGTSPSIPVTTQQGYSSDSQLTNMIHASLKSSNLPKPQNTPATKLRNLCGSFRSRDRPSAVQEVGRYKGTVPKAAAPSTGELQLRQPKTTSESSQKNRSSFTALTARPVGKNVFFFFRDCKREERCSSPSGDLIMKACYLETEVFNRTHYATDCTSSADSPSNSKAHIQILWQKQTVVWDLPWTRRNAWALL